LLDRREGRCAHRIGVPRAAYRDDRAATPAARRARGARPRCGNATRRGVRALRARDRLSHDHALDEQRAGGRTPHLRGGRLPAHPQGAPHELRSRSRGRDLGEAALTRRALATAAAAVTGVQVGSVMVATRFVVDQTGPASLALLRYAIGVLVLLPAVLVAARDVAPIALLGIVQFGVLIALLNYGLRFVPSARAALIFATVPLLAMLLAVAFGHERLSATRAVGVLLTIAGVGLALGEKMLRGGDDPHGWLGEAA